MLRINFVLEKEVAVYEDDPCILRQDQQNFDSFLMHNGYDARILRDNVRIKINDEIYNFVDNTDSLEGAKDSIGGEFTLEDAKDSRGGEFRFSKFSVKSEEKEPGFFSRSSQTLHARWVICNYCGAHAVCEAKISLRKITIYKRPPIGARDMKVKVTYGYDSLYRSPYVYKVRSTSAYCKKCGSTE